MNISSNNQLVPYHHGLRQLAPYWSRGPGSAPSDSYPATRQAVLMPPSHSPGTNGHITIQNLIYTSDRRFKAQEINHVGSLIDIYA